MQIGYIQLPDTLEGDSLDMLFIDHTGERKQLNELIKCIGGNDTVIINGPSTLADNLSKVIEVVDLIKAKGANVELPSGALLERMNGMIVIKPADENKQAVSLGREEQEEPAQGLLNEVEQLPLDGTEASNETTARDWRLLPEETIAEIKRLSKLGYASHKVSEILKVSASTVCKYRDNTCENKTDERTPLDVTVESDKPKKHGGQPISDEKIAEIKRLEKLGYDSFEISKEVGVSEPTVRKYWGRPKKKKKVTPELTKQVNDLAATGLNSIQIADRLGVHPRVVSECWDREKYSQKLTDDKINAIKSLGRLEYSAHKIAKMVGVSWDTAAKYLEQAQ